MAILHRDIIILNEGLKLVKMNNSITYCTPFNPSLMRLPRLPLGKPRNDNEGKWYCHAHRRRARDDKKIKSLSLKNELL
jgi:hypothetical protein